MTKEKLENWNDLSDEERAQLAAKTPIAKDDADALCNPKGWAKFQERAKGSRKAKGEDEGLAGARTWLCSAKDDPARVLFVEVERAQDARRVSSLLLGGVAVEVQRFDDVDPRPRVQARWTGSAAGCTPDLRIQTRRVDKKGNVGRWSDLR